MRAFSAIVKLTLKSVLRSHVFQVLFCILLFTIIILPITVTGDGTARAQIQVSLQYCLGTVSFILSLSSIWLGCFAMSNDVETYQIHMVLAKPVSRVMIWLGKCTGIIIIHSILLLFSAFIVYILVLCQFQDQMFLKYTQWPLGVIMGLSGIIFLIVLFIWLNNSFLKFFRIRFIKSDMKKQVVSNLLIKLGIGAFAVLLISSTVFVALQWQFKKQNFSLKEKTRIRNEVLVGRKVYMPQLPDIEKLAENVYERRLEQMPASYNKLPDDFKEDLLFEIKKSLLSQKGEVTAGSIRYWLYEGLDPESRSPIFLRYRPYIGQISTRQQRKTMGLWGCRVFIPQKNLDPTSEKKRVLRSVFSKISQYPEQFMCGIFHEKVIPPQIRIVSPEGKAVIGFKNFDPKGQTIFFQPADGPQLLIKVTGFINNYCRGIFMIFLKLVFITGLACSIGGLVSAPVAIFTAVSYLLAGVFASYIIGFEEAMSSGGPRAPTSDISLNIGNILSSILNVILIPIQKFEVSYMLAAGELIEWRLIGELFVFNLLLRGLPLILIGIWFYKRREMGLVIKK